MKLLLLSLLLLLPGHTSRDTFKVGCAAVADNVLIRAPRLSEGEYVQIGIKAKGKLLPTYMITNDFFYVWTWARRGTFEAKIRVGDDYRDVQCTWSRARPFRRPR